MDERQDVKFLFRGSPVGRCFCGAPILSELKTLKKRLPALFYGPGVFPVSEIKFFDKFGMCIRHV
jgi:hypothetical protein